MRRVLLALSVVGSLVLGAAIQASADSTDLQASLRAEAAETLDTSNLLTEAADALAAQDAYIAELEGQLGPAGPSSSPSPKPSPSPTVSPTTSPKPSPSPSTSPTPPPEPSTCDATVTAPGSIQNASNAQPQGATICLSGTFTVSSPIHPKDGQSFVGPAELVGATHSGFELKGGGGNPIDADNVSIVDLEMHGFSIRAIECWEGTYALRVNLHDNGRNGIGCGLQDVGGVVIEDSQVHHNGSTDELGRGGGGMKFARAGSPGVSGVQVIGGSVEFNIGNGIWCDVECDSFTVRGVKVHGNTRKGVFFEISYGPALIEDNTVTSNNCAPSVWGDGNPECALPDGSFGPQSAGSPGGGITMNSSCPDEGPGCIIRGNVGGDNAVAFLNFRDDGRPDGGDGIGGWAGYDAPFDILASGNQRNGDAVLNCDIAGITCTNNG